MSITITGTLAAVRPTVKGSGYGAVVCRMPSGETMEVFIPKASVPGYMMFKGQPISISVGVHPTGGVSVAQAKVAEAASESSEGSYKGIQTQSSADVEYGSEFQ